MYGHVQVRVFFVNRETLTRKNTKLIGNGVLVIYCSSPQITITAVVHRWQQWLDDLKPLGTDASKPYLETAPWLIAVFSQKFGETETGEKSQNYYVHESVGIAVGMLITSLHNAGLATLTHTPKPMNFLTEVCQRPNNERAYMLIIAGYPADNATIPAHAMQKKSLSEIASFL